MPDYTVIAAKVLAGLTKAGIAMTLTKVASDGVFDPTTGEYVYGRAPIDYSVIGLIQARSLYQTGAVGQNFFNRVLVLTDDQFILLATGISGIVPAPGDLLIIVGVTFTVVTAIPVRPGGVDLMHRVLARK